MPKRAPLALATALVLMAALVLAGCGFLRDLSSPSARLVGHWIDDENNEYFFGPATTERPGTFIYRDADEQSETHSYDLIDEDPDEHTVTVRLLYTDREPQTVTYLIPPDGIFMRKEDPAVPEDQRREFVFVDTRTAPPPYEETARAREG